jgi:pilus assembly protein CpaF
MRPDRIVVGECRGGETIDMLQAMNTGHDGSLTTIHANSPRDALSRLETLSLMSGLDLPLKVIREQIASAVDLIIQQTRMKDGSRKVTHVTEVAGMEGDVIVMTDIFKFEQTGLEEDGTILGKLKPTGMRPMFMHRLERYGYHLTPDVFGAGYERNPITRDQPRRRR